MGVNTGHSLGKLCREPLFLVFFWLWLLDFELNTAKSKQVQKIINVDVLKS